VTEELRSVRDWARAEIQAGHLQGETWNRYVLLVEAAEAVLQQRRVAANIQNTRLRNVEVSERRSASNENRRPRIHSQKPR
jgi:hypothetical protein